MLLLFRCLLCTQADSQPNADWSPVISSQNCEFLGDAFSDSCMSYTAPSDANVALLLAVLLIAWVIYLLILCVRISIGNPRDLPNWVHLPKSS